VGVVALGLLGMIAMRLLPKKAIQRFEGHSNSVFSVAFSPDGKSVVSGSGVKTVRLWNVATGQQIGRGVPR
jgi:WD40 repeat protein